MKPGLDDILAKPVLEKEDILCLLMCGEEDQKKLFARAAEVKEKYVGNIVYFRGLIEYSNICSKNCLYCGVRSGNCNVERYQMTDEEVFEASDYAFQNGFASLVIQSGERHDASFIGRISYLLEEIKARYKGQMRVTLSCGEQREETYRQWQESGVQRYLLRIETSNPKLYSRLHPDDGNHIFQERVNALDALIKLGYQAGTGVMIGLPFQTIDQLADDLLFFREKDFPMFGMGPYIEHAETPLYQYKDLLWTEKERFTVSLKMVAVLRLMMKDVNIAATTAMQTLDPLGREKAIMAGANVIMPNLTPLKYRRDYQLYEGKPCLDEEADQCKVCLESRIRLSGNRIGYGEWGDSLHYQKNNLKMKNQKV